MSSTGTASNGHMPSAAVKVETKSRTSRDRILRMDILSRKRSGCSNRAHADLKSEVPCSMPKLTALAYISFSLPHQLIRQFAPVVNLAQRFDDRTRIDRDGAIHRFVVI